MMADTDVVIVGAGPAGLVMAIALAQKGTRSVILEKNTEICEDPRAIALSGDGQRILEVLGISTTQLDEVAQLMPALHFHTGEYTAPPFLSINQTVDWLDQILPPAIVLFQPGLERVLRDKARTEYTELRLGCEVRSIKETAGAVTVEYEGPDGSQSITGRFLIGADGKRGCVRKGYLEAKGIRQETGVYGYEATWIAANLLITLPTPVSHPDFPLWKLGYGPDELWDIFWPDGFHFCRHPTMPVATGRFGPKNGKYWRFEYELPPRFQPRDSEKHLLEQMLPHMTLPGSYFMRDGKSMDYPVQFPADCLHVVRCGPAHFTNKVVNRWFHNNIILIGDAAHVFAPFGAQGLANGIRDAFTLSWRIGHLLHSTVRGSDAERLQADILEAWSCERRKGVDDASMQTRLNGDLLLGKSTALALAVKLGKGFFDYIPSYRDWLLRKLLSDKSGLGGVKNGLFLCGLSDGGQGTGDPAGGSKTAQVIVRNFDGSAVSGLSDRLFWDQWCPLTLLLFGPREEQEVAAIRQTIKDAALPTGLLSDEILELRDELGLPPQEDQPSPATKVVVACDTAQSGGLNQHTPLPQYSAKAFRMRFRATALCALVRPDFIIFAQADTPAQLAEQLKTATGKLFGDITSPES